MVTRLFVSNLGKSRDAGGLFFTHHASRIRAEGSDSVMLDA